MINALKDLWARRESDDGLWTGDGDDLIVLHHPDGRFARLSQSALRITGHPAESLIDEPLTRIIAPDDRGIVLNALSHACYHGGRGRAEFRIMRRDGTIGWAEMTASVDAKGRVRSIIRDITQRRAHDQEQTAAREHAEEQAAAHTTYLADLSHEIRTPLNAVIGFAEMMRHETFGPLGHQKYEEYAGLIHKSGQHLLSLVSDLLDLSKIEAERYTLEPAPTDLAGLISDCVEMTRLGAEEAGLVMSTDIDALKAPVMADQKVLRQIILNLLSNAVKFTREGKIEVRLRHDEANAWISVIDTGIGMSEEQLANIGKRFTEAQRDGVRGAKGTGLGLALCAALAKLHDGTLRVASREGEGTRAVLCLPLVKAAEEGGSDTASPADDPRQADSIAADNTDALEALGSQLDRLCAQHEKRARSKDVA